MTISEKSHFIAYQVIPLDSLHLARAHIWMCKVLDQPGLLFEKIAKT